MVILKNTEEHESLLRRDDFHVNGERVFGLSPYAGMNRMGVVGVIEDKSGLLTKYTPVVCSREYQTYRESKGVEGDSEMEVIMAPVQVHNNIEMDSVGKHLRLLGVY